MSFVMDVRNPGNVCRLCLTSRAPLSSVFEDQVHPFRVATKIRLFLSIEIQTSDELSTMICVNCLQKVNKWHSYKESCLNLQENLRRILKDQLENVRYMKEEPLDEEEPITIFKPVRIKCNASDVEWQEDPDSFDDSPIKKELLEDEENNANAEIESVRSRELLLNPMAVAGNKDDRILEAESTQKLLKAKKLRVTKKKSRRGPTTHYRGTRRYKKRCPYCQIYLHSKHSFGKHMERFHGGTGPVTKAREKQGDLENDPAIQENGAEDHAEKEAEEMVEDVEDELISLEKDAPLTPVQQNIISQLKTFSCYTCQECFQDRRSTLNHIRQHMPDLRPYTCIACLTEFADRSIYKLHCCASFQCAMKIALVVPEHGTEKYFTCNMCLRPLTNRKELLSHLSKHSDKQYEQLIAGPFRPPPKLKPMTSVTSSPSGRRGKTDSTSIAASNINRAPYKNGDPAHNNMCTYCGMIYRYKQNMFKHVELCKKLPTEDRISYRCAHCGLTFLAVKRFHSHLNVEHKTRDIACFHCDSKFTEPDEYAEHYRRHRINNMPSTRDKERSSRVKCWSGGSQAHQVDTTRSNTKTSASFSCALCPGSIFSTRNLLAEHRKVHLKLKIYSCAICRRMFGRASALEAHMTDHDLEVPSSELDANTSIPLVEHDEKINASINSDPGTSNTECHSCGKVFANYPNLRRHERNVHDNTGRFSCFTCAKTFKSEDQWAHHVENEHKHMEPAMSCPQCPEEFQSSQALETHRQNVHGVNGEDQLACYICGKKFLNESSLRIHRGHHFRVNSRLSVGNRQQAQLNQKKQRIDSSASTGQGSIASQVHVDEEPVPGPSSVKSPRARKSFPNPCSIRQLPNTLQCQVCDDRFTDVSSLRKHLWDVHCARNKPEKTFSTEKLQCELCTNVLPDEESLASHMKWHESNPILSNGGRRETPAECDLCGKFYSSKANLWKHKKRHKARNVAALKLQSIPKKNWGGNGFTCQICRKVFATRSTLKKHKAAAHSQSQHRAQSSHGSSKRQLAGNSREPQLIKPMRPKLDFDTLIDHANFASSESSNSNAKKPVTCTLCRRIVPSMRALYKHRQHVHKIIIGKTAAKPELEMLSSMQAENGDESTTRCPCTACPKIFSNRSNMRQHFTKVHGPSRTSEFQCTVEGCNLGFKTSVAKQNHERTHLNVMYTCALCPRYMLSRAAMTEHMLTAHKTNYTTGNSKMMLCKKISLDNYTIKGATGRQCPICKVNYPNFKSMKIHYLKIHEGAA